MTFNQQLILTLIDKAVIGCLLVLAGFAFNRLLEAYKSNQLQQFEIFRNQLAARDDANRNVSLAIADIAKKIASGNQLICWLTWAARNCRVEITKQCFYDYEREMKALLNELVASRVHLAALDNDKQNALSPVIEKLYGLDVKVGLAKAEYLASEQRGLDALSDLYEASNEFDKELLSVATNMVSHKH